MQKTCIKTVLMQVNIFPLKNKSMIIKHIIMKHYALPMTDEKVIKTTIFLSLKISSLPFICAVKNWIVVLR